MGKRHSFDREYSDDYDFRFNGDPAGDWDIAAGTTRAHVGHGQLCNPVAVSVTG